MTEVGPGGVILEFNGTTPSPRLAIKLSEFLVFCYIDSFVLSHCSALQMKKGKLPESKRENRGAVSYYKAEFDELLIAV